MTNTVLEVNAVSKRFRRGQLHDSLRDLLPSLGRRLIRAGAAPEHSVLDFWALQDVSFTVEEGEAFAIVGGNGAGKSTMLKLLSRIMRPTSGAVSVEGRLSALIEVSAGFHPDLTGRENIYLNGAILGMSRSEIARRFDEIVAFSGLEQFLDTQVKRYSSGMYARLGFSVAAHVDADVLLIDEVLSVGDYLFQRKCVERMNEVIRGGTTVVFVSHNLKAVTELCHRSLLLERGRVGMIGPTTDVVRTYLSRGGVRHDVKPGQPVSIVSVTVEGPDGTAIGLPSGGRARVTVDAHALTDIDDVTLLIQVADEQQYALFDTCSQRLGAGPLSIRRGETAKCVFDLDLELAEGTYYINAYIHQYVTGTTYDRWDTAATFFVRGTPSMRGVVNLHPRLTSCAVCAASAIQAPVSAG